MKIKEKLGESSQLRPARRPARRLPRHRQDRLRPLLHAARPAPHQPMYQYSLPMFLELFRKALGARQLAAALPAERVRMLSPLLQQLVFGSVSRSLFKATASPTRCNSSHDPPELFGEASGSSSPGRCSSRAARARRPAAVGARGPRAAPSPRSRPPAAARRAELPRPAVGAVGASEACETAGRRRCRRARRPSRRSSSSRRCAPSAAVRVRLFVTSTLSIPSLSPASSSIPEIATNDSTAAIPILMITTAGADPTQELEDYAKREKPGAYKQLAMGGQQTAAAISMLHEAARTGSWLCLKNLTSSSTGCRRSRRSSRRHAAPDFRLWLTTSSTPTSRRSSCSSRSR